MPEPKSLYFELSCPLQEEGVYVFNPRHTKLITALRTAVENGEGALDKEATSYDDLLDAFRMSLQFWH
jgi:hypothetical protein